MGAKASKPAFSRCDDIVHDNIDAIDKLRQVLCLASHPLRTPVPSCPGSPRKTNERLFVQVHCSGESPTAAAAATGPAGAHYDGPRQSLHTDEDPARAEAGQVQAQDDQRAIVDAIFQDFDVNQQEQEKANAMAALAASANSGEKALLSDVERCMLREHGAAARAQEEEQLAAHLAASDEELKAMDTEQRGEWFEAHAQRCEADAVEPSFDDEWAALPPEILAMAAELAARG